MDNPFEVLSHKLEAVEGMLAKLLVVSGKSTQPIAVQEPNLTVEQAAQVLGVSKSAVYQNLGKLPHHKRFGRLYFYESELHRYIRTSPDSRVCA